MSRKTLNANDELWKKIQFKVFEKRIADCFQLFRQNGIEPILIKGWAASQYYPAKWQRLFTDIDLCIEPSSFETAQELINLYEGGNLGLDLHRGFRKLDTMSWEDLFEKSQVIELEGVGIRVLSPEDHLRVLSVHWFWDGGAYREKLWDIYYLVETRPDDFDWERCLDVISKKRRKWIVCSVGLAHKYLGLDISGTPVFEEAEDLPPWLVKAVEKEWQSEIRLTPLIVSRNNFRTLVQQIKKRIPPNPIQATIEMEGYFEKYPRIYYQILNIFQRLKASTFKYIKFKVSGVYE